MPELRWLLAWFRPSLRTCSNYWHDYDYSKWKFPKPDNAKDCLVNEVSKTCKRCGQKVQMTGWNYPLAGNGDYSPRFTTTPGRVPPQRSVDPPTDRTEHA